MDGVTLIVLTNHDGAIGVPEHAPRRFTDLSFFRQVTAGATVAMGRGAYESFGGRPLPDRYNIVLSRRAGLSLDVSSGGLAHSVDEALMLASLRREPCFVIGGASIYQQFLPYADTCLLILVDALLADGGAGLNKDTMFSEKNWKLVAHRTYPASESEDTPFTVFEMRSRLQNITKARVDHAIDEYRAGLRPVGRGRKPTRKPGGGLSFMPVLR